MPYEYCDHFLEINKTESIESLYYPKDLQPAVPCRVTATVPKNYRIAFNCLALKKSSTQVKTSTRKFNCLSQIVKPKIFPIF